MKHINHYALTVASAVLMCGAVAAQERTAQQPLTQNRQLKSGEVQASHLIGAPVKNTAGETIGEVTDLIVSSGDVKLAVISVGGLLGVGDKRIALPYEQITVAPDGNTLFVSMTEEELTSKAAFDADGHDVDQKAAVNRPAGERAAAPAPTPRSTTEVRRDVQAPERTAAPERATSAPKQPATAAGANAARTLKASEQPASSLIGAPVVDSENAKIGKIHDLIVTAGPQEPQAIVAVGGGVAGLGARMVAVPLDKLTIKRDADEDRRREPDSVQTLLTVSQLESMPEFRYE
jgi:sporulation protein YlmC with PRC-barrel domain